MNPKILIVAGATASGKSALALDLAEKSGGVIINADSQQLYAELRVLTARPTPEEEAHVPHRLYGILPAAEAASAGKWLRFAQMEIAWALSEGKTAVVVGGTGLYLKALMEGIAEIPDVPPEVRTQTRNDFDAMGRVAFYERLKVVDPVSCIKLRPGDTQRILRAYEVWLGSGKPLSFWHEKTKVPFYTKELLEVVHVERERAELYARCDARVHAMINDGALHEVENLLKQLLPPDLPSMRIIGVPELGAHLRGECSLEEAIARMQQMTRNYAKRQMTWFRHQLKN